MQKLFIIYILILFSCKDSKDAGIMIGNNLTFSFLSFIDSIQLLPLPDDNNFIIGNIDKLKRCDSLFYFLDQQKTKTLYAFNITKGAFIDYRNEGRGPNEYISIYDFDIDELNRKISILCYPLKIFITDMHLNIQKIIPLNQIYSKISYHDNKIYLYSNRERSLYVINEQDSVPQQIFTEKSLPQLVDNGEPIFHKVNQKLLYHARGSDKIYQIQQKNLNALITLNYKNKRQILKRMASERKLTEQEILMTPPTVQNIFRIQNNYGMIYTYNGVVRLCILDIQNKKVLHDGIAQYLPLNNILYHNNNIFSWEFIFEQNDLKTNFPGIKYSLPSPFLANEEDNPYILKYYLKNHL